MSNRVRNEQAYYAKNKERVKARARQWAAANVEKRKDVKLRYWYGMSLEQARALLMAQGGVCRICQRPITEQTWHVDHDHTLLRVRGLLCAKCNKALGMLGDDSENGIRLAAYLREQPTPYVAKNRIRGGPDARRRVTDEAAGQIGRRALAGERVRALAAEFGISVTTVYDIRREAVARQAANP